MLGLFKAKDTIGCNSADKMYGFAAPATWQPAASFKVLIL